MKLKKSIAVFIATLILMTVVFSTSSLGANISIDGFNFQRIGNNTAVAEITGITAGSPFENDAIVTVPSSISGNLIVSIGTKAFANNNVHQEFILPDSITNISNLAFYNSNALKKATIPLNVQTIDTRAFSYCPNLETINFNTNKLQIISKALFYNCTSLNDVKIPTSINTIETLAFARCTSLNRIYIPANVSVIEDDVFLYSDNVTIYGKLYSPAHYYALENGIPFEELSTNRDIFMLNNWIVATQYQLSGDTTVYIPETLQNLKIAYENAVAVKNDFFSTQAQIDTATNNLSIAFNALKLNVMLDLEATVSTAKTYTNDTNYYTQQSFAELQSTIDSAEVLIRKFNPTHIEVVNMMQLLNDKINALVLQSRVDLQALVANANNTINTSAYMYTEASITDLTTAIANANAVLNVADSTNDELLAQIDLLTQATNSLIPETIGDVDLDSNVTVTDVILVLKNVVELEDFNTKQKYTADVNADGSITVLDAVLIQQIILELN